MPGERIGRAVLELTTDLKPFLSDTDQAQKRVVSLKGEFEQFIGWHDKPQRVSSAPSRDLGA